jgi:hypothetical protein
MPRVAATFAIAEGATTKEIALVLEGAAITGSVFDAAGRPARAVVDAVFASIERFSRGALPQDDRTVMVVTYPIGEAVTVAFPRPTLPGAPRS